MVSQSLQIVMLLTALAGNGGGDLMDLVPGDAYWRKQQLEPTVAALLPEIRPVDAKDVGTLIADLGALEFQTREAAARRIAAVGPAALPALRRAATSDDPEVANSARGLIQAITAAGRGAGVRRLMAIRTLGELKAREALPDLKALLDSPDPFVADYARLAIARIEGKPATRPVDAARLEADVWMMPAGSAIVGQLAARTGRPLNPAPLLARLKANKNAGGGMFGPVDVDKQLLEPCMDWLGRLGNVRLDGLTIALSGDDFNNTGWVVIIARGRYDVAAVREALLAGKELTQQNLDGMDYCASKEVAVAMPSETCLIFMAGPNQQKLPLAEIARALRAGKGALSDNAAMAQLVRGVDRRQFLWLASKLSDNQKKNMDALDTMVLEGNRNGDAVDLRMMADGTDPAAIKDTAAKLKAGIEESIKSVNDLKGMLNNDPALDEVAAFLKGLQVTSENTRLSMRGSLDTNMATSTILRVMGVVAGLQPFQPPVPADLPDPEPLQR